MQDPKEREKILVGHDKSQGLLSHVGQHPILVNDGQHAAPRWRSACVVQVTLPTPPRGRGWVFAQAASRRKRSKDMKGAKYAHQCPKIRSKSSWPVGSAERNAHAVSRSIFEALGSLRSSSAFSITRAANVAAPTR